MNDHEKAQADEIWALLRMRIAERNACESAIREIQKQLENTKTQIEVLRTRARNLIP